MQMDGKVCVVTGTTSGIGRVTAMELARMGATVVMICRSRDKAETVRREIDAASPGAKVGLIIADLTMMAEVRAAVRDFEARYDRLDVLINNAGAIRSTRELTAEGLEATFAGNYLSTFLLTELLLGRLKASAPSRIVNVSSDGHFGASIDFGNLMGERRYNFLRAYKQSKLAQVLYTYDLAIRLAGTGVTANVLHPGLVASNFVDGTSGLMALVARIIYRLQGISSSEGARTTLYLATSPHVAATSGKYFENCAERRSSALSYDAGLRERLTAVSREITGLVARQSRMV